MKQIAFIYFNDEFKNKIEYTVNTIFRDYEVDVLILSVHDFKHLNQKFDLVISYGNVKDSSFVNIVLLEGHLFSNEYLTLKSIPTEIQSFDGLPVFFMNRDEDYFKKDVGDKLMSEINLL